MYPYHEVLAMFEPHVEFYVVDLETSPLGFPHLNLTVLTDRLLSRQLQDDIADAIDVAMTMEHRVRLAYDLGWPEPDANLVFLSVKVRYFGKSAK